MGEHMKLLVLVSILMMVIGCSEDITTKYSTYEEAKKDGLFQRGWLPDILPTSTIDIKITSDPDKNSSFGEFFIGHSSLDVFLDKIEQTDNINEYRFIQGGSQWIFTVTREGLVTYRLDAISAN